jgi:hypothetical protein
VTAIKHDYYEVRCPLLEHHLEFSFEAVRHFQLSAIAPRLSGLKALLDAHLSKNDDDDG